MQTNLGTLLKGKRVVVVGRAHYLLNNPFLEDQADFIDGHDIVVRINTPMPHFCKHPEFGNSVGSFVNPKWQNILGKQTDLYFTNRENYLNIPNVLDTFVDDGGKAICNFKFKNEKYKIISRRILKVCIHHEISSKIYQKLVDVSFTVGGYKSSREKVLCGNGHLTLTQILAYDVQEVSMIGFTQSQTSDPRAIKLFNEVQNNHPFHSPIHGLLIFRIMIQNDSRIKPDAMLLSVFDDKKEMLDELEQQIDEFNKQMLRGLI